MPLEYLIEHKSIKMDEWITHAIYDLENMAILTEMFFEAKDRGPFKEITQAAIDFKYELHKATANIDETSKLSIYDSARVDFNKKYADSMGNMVEMINKRLLGQWEYDVTSVRVPKFLSKQGRYKGHQQ